MNGCTLTADMAKCDQPRRWCATADLTTSNSGRSSTVAVINSIVDCPKLPEIAGVEFRHCLGFPGYAVGSDGVLWSCRHRYGSRPWRRIRPAITADGYKQASLRRDGANFSMKIATLVAEAFLGARPERMEVCHCDGTRTNDTPNNLRWATHQENIDDTAVHGSRQRQGKAGASNNAARLTEKDVLEIRAMYPGCTQVELARRFGIKQPQVSEIIRRVSWRNLP